MSRDGAEEVRRLVALPLRAGGLAAVAVIGIGFLLDLGQAPDLGRAEPRPLLDLIMSGESGVIAAGLLLLTLVPLVMVLAAAVGFARGHETRYLAASLTVMALMIASIVLSVVVLPA